ncbi:peptidoglycan editing factor PgeF [Undibacterium sp. Ren11W]|uniref:peptidoglycan editing factor PgeF n=1 Tax=Undibacterium sp. Ren11W TaxID=3413045 RepID=UPI003BF31E8B
MRNTPVRDIAQADFSVISPDWSCFPQNVHAFTTMRKAGASAFPYDDGYARGGFNLGAHVGDDLDVVRRNQDALNQYLPSNIIFLSQKHGTVVCDAALAVNGCEADACFTNQGAIACAILTADCLPVLFSDTRGTVVAAAHAGWRGLASGILQNTVKEMREAGAEEIVAWLGPAIGPAQFEVGQDVYDAFSKILEHTGNYFVNQLVGGRASGKYLADIYGLAKSVLSSVGVNSVHGGEHCTVSAPENFYSYRRDGVTGRMASVIWMD